MLRNAQYVDPSAPVIYHNNSSLQYAQACQFIDENRLIINPPVLDVGCGNGKVTAYLAEKVGGPIVGADISADRIAFAQQQFLNPAVKFVVGNCLALNDTPELSTQHYQTIVSFNTIHHFPKSEQLSFFKQVREHLDEDGIALFMFPNGKSEMIRQVAAAASSAKWSEYFVDFDFSAVRTYERADYYQQLAQESGFYGYNAHESQEDVVEMNFDGMKNFIAGWLPHLAHLKMKQVSVNIQDEFLNDIVSRCFAVYGKRVDETIKPVSDVNKLVLYPSKLSIFKAKKAYDAALQDAKEMAFGI